MQWLERRLRRRASEPAESRQLAAAGAGAPGFEFVADREVRKTIDLRRDRTSSMLVWLFVLLALVLAAGLVFGTFAKQESMRGYVTATTGAVRINTDFAGTVKRVQVAQGETVRKGQVLFTIVQEQASTGTGTISESLIRSLGDQRRNLEVEIQRLNGLIQADPVDRKTFDADFESSLASLDAQERSLARVLAEQEASVRKLERFVEQGYATRETLSGQSRISVEYARQLSEVRLRRTELLSTRTERRRTLDLSVTEASNRRAELENRIRDIDSQLYAAESQGEVAVLAPSDGQIATLAVRESSPVERGQFVAALADPDSELRIALEAPSRSVGLVNVGDRVVLKYAAFPFKTFGIQYGTVTAISSAALSIPREFQSIDPRKPAESTFLVEVEPESTLIEAYGEKRPILIGSTLTADVVVERRRLIQWVLDPLLAARGRL